MASATATKTTRQRARGKPNPEWQAKFLAELAEVCNVTAAAELAGVNRATAYRYRDEDPEFAALWDAAELEGHDRLEREAWRRAKEGWDEPVFQGGIEVGTIRRYSDPLMQTLLKGHKPEKYKDRAAIDHTTAGKPIIPLVFRPAEPGESLDE